eukprot:UN06739
MENHDADSEMICDITIPNMTISFLLRL